MEKNKLPYRQTTFGNSHSWVSKKMKVIVTNAEGTVKLTDFDSLPNRLDVILSCFPEIMANDNLSAYKAILRVKEQHKECPDDQNFWDWYISVRKIRVRTMHREFIVMFRWLQEGGYYSRTYKQAFLNYRLHHKDGVRRADLVLTEDEIAYIIRAEFNNTSEGIHKRRALDMFIMSLFTGARVADIRHCARSIDEAGNPIVLFHNKKGTRTQSIAWNDAMAGPFERGLFKSPKSCRPSVLYASLKAALYDALPSSSNRLVNYYYLNPGRGRELKTDSRLSHITFHTARHTFCTRLLRSGVSPSIVAQLAGHKSLATTMRYYNWTRDKEANDILRSVYGANSVASTAPKWGEGASVKPLPVEVHQSMLPPAKLGDIVPDDAGLKDALKVAMTKWDRPTASQKRLIEEIKRRGLV